MGMIRFLEVPYKKRGRELSGCDCYGFVRLVLLERGINLPLYDFEGCGGEKDKALELIKTKKKDFPEDFNIIYLSHPGSEHIGVYLKGAVWQMTSNGVSSRPWSYIKGQVKGIYEVEG